MADFDGASLSEAERELLRALNDLGVRFLLVGMSAALLQGARRATEDHASPLAPRGVVAARGSGP
jgi:hypothetical protein